MKGRINWDALGIAASVACAIHCAILPLMLGTLPILGIELIDNVRFEYFMIFLAFAIGVYSLWHGYRRHHHSKVPVLIFSAGIIFLVAKQVWHEFQYWLLPIAILMIVTAHLQSLPRSQSCAYGRLQPLKVFRLFARRLLFLQLNSEL